MSLQLKLRQLQRTIREKHWNDSERCLSDNIKRIYSAVIMCTIIPTTPRWRYPSSAHDNLQLAPKVTPGLPRETRLKIYRRDSHVWLVIWKQQLGPQS